jgi:glycosyltransferase involved in cell wall biosynthesis
MKILHLITTLAGGGAEFHLLTLCRYQKKQGMEVVVACLSEFGKDSRSLRRDFENEGIRVIRLCGGHRFELRSFSRIVRLVETEQPNIFHTHLPRADLTGALARFLNPSVAWVCSLHAIYSDDWSGRWSLPLLRFLWNRADAIICISHAVSDWLIEGGMPADRTKVIYYGIEPDKFSQPRVDLRKEWALNGSAIIGSIGRLEPRKGHDCLIEAMGALVKRLPNVLLLIAGHDSWGYGVTLGRRIDELGLKDRVRLIGFQDDVVSFLSALDVFAFATNSEGFGQVLVEAMAMAKPVVASRIPPINEIVVDGETGSLAECGSPKAFAEAIARLLTDPEKRVRMGARGRERVKTYFTAERMTQETVLLYEQSLGRKSALRSMA